MRVNSVFVHSYTISLEVKVDLLLTINTLLLLVLLLVTYKTNILEI